MSNHRTGTMARRGEHARDTGSTTGVATAVLALLSAGTLASLGLVTADEIRGGTARSLRTPYSDLLPPVDVVVPQAPTGRATGPRGGTPPPPAAPGPFEPVALTGGAAGGDGPSVSAAGPGVVVAGPPAIPVPPPQGPVFTSVQPVPAPSVLATKHGRALGHAHSRGQAKKLARAAQGTAAAAATPTSLTFLGTTPATRGHVGRPDTAPGRSPKVGHSRGPHRAPPAAATDPAVAVAVPAAAATPGAEADHGNGKGRHAYGHDGD